VSGSDANVYPPMSTQLEAAGITVGQGYEPAHLVPPPDLVVIGNAMSRGNPAVEHVLNEGLRYVSGPQWLAEHVLDQRWVLAVAGTHGKTTTASMLAWILEHAGLSPGFLIGGVPRNFGVSARAGESPFFVIEADEYDTAFFDKRSKFVHYRPRTLVMNNLEFDHADIFDDLEAIQRQFHHLVRTVPGHGLIISPLNDGNLHDVLDRGCWTRVGALRSLRRGHWHVADAMADGSAFDVICETRNVGRIEWALTGQHNVANALAALAAARHAGVPPALAIEALNRFDNVKRRMELRGEVGGVRVYDDFAHHPTAIRLTLEGLRASVGDARILAVLEPRSNTMRMGVHATQLADALQRRRPGLGLFARQLSDGMSRGCCAGSAQQPMSALRPQDIVEQVSTAAATGRPGRGDEQRRLRGYSPAAAGCARAAGPPVGITGFVGKPRCPQWVPDLGTML
jgi:UDP-N-acetylmuramate: L-alanyl-gamma-D-glutamyl-meso-diaminopimelate ligase